MAEEKPKEEKTEEPKGKWTFHLRCSKCSFRFTIERESADMNKVDITKMKCLECGSPIQWDISNFPVTVGPSHEFSGKMNIEASKTALEMAAKMKMKDKELGEDKMVPVTNNQPGKNYGKTEMIPEKVLKSIEEKVAPEIGEIDKD